VTQAEPTRDWTPLALVEWTREYFARHGVPSARLDAELLLAHVLGAGRLDLYLRFEEPVGTEARGAYRELVRRRAEERVPVAYLTGVREFWSLPLRVTPEVLIPRPETETLVRAVADLRPARVADVGTGSGALAAALATELPEARIEASDVSPAAAEVARQNLAALGLAERVAVRVGEGLAPLEGSFDAIASNPPYIPSGDLDRLPPEVRHEPRLALDGGPDGLRVIGMLVAEAPARLAPGGWLALEVGEGQAGAVEALLREAGAAAVTRRKDLAGAERVVLGRFGGEGD
jgi:release factor glutamine methyltransferase